jgi:hypothetical protein
MPSTHDGLARVAEALDENYRCADTLFVHAQALLACETLYAKGKRFGCVVVDVPRDESVAIASLSSLVAAFTRELPDVHICVASASEYTSIEILLGAARVDTPTTGGPTFLRGKVTAASFARVSSSADVLILCGLHDASAQFVVNVVMPAVCSGASVVIATTSDPLSAAVQLLCGISSVVTAGG